MLTLTSPAAGVLHGGADLLGDAAGLVMGALGQQHGELVATDARDGVPGAHGAADRVPDAAQQLIAGVVAVAVVERLELVDVDREQRAALPEEAEREQAVLERAAVGQRCERVAVGEVAVLRGTPRVAPGDPARLGRRGSGALALTSGRGRGRGRRARAQLLDRRWQLLRRAVQQSFDGVEQDNGVWHPRIWPVTPRARDAVAAEHDPAGGVGVVDGEDRGGQTRRARVFVELSPAMEGACSATNAESELVGTSAPR